MIKGKAMPKQKKKNTAQDRKRMIAAIAKDCRDFFNAFDDDVQNRLVQSLVMYIISKIGIAVKIVSPEGEEIIHQIKKELRTGQKAKGKKKTK